MKDALPVRVRFGAFELDLKAGELRLRDAPEDERRIVLPDQPFRLLVMLVERQGTIVTREEIQKKFWPNDTIVEFDHSINVAIGKLRKALGDSADEPQYIATVARRGYRLIVPVEWLGADESFGEVSGGAGGAAVRLQPEPGLIGKKVSHYRVLQVIGAGGMGLVYKAEDLKLHRQVALKFLPEELVTDPAALQRFEREAQTASSLNHPNICTIYEVEEHEAEPFIVMELLEGETLRERLARLAAARQVLALDQLLDFGVQICAGLQAAHDRGIIHRDIKPANLFLTASGQVKILDFGVAKLAAATEAAALSKDQSDSKANHAQVLPTSMAANDRSLTRTGAAMGTAGYMSPEQVRGEKVDGRTDLFSFGLVLYEMATGQRAFSGETQAVLYDSILNATAVPAHDLNSTLPPNLERIVSKALEKDPKQRFQSAAEIRTALQDVKRAAENKVPRRMLTAWAAGVLVLVALAIGFYLRRASKAPRPGASSSSLQMHPLTGHGKASRATATPDGSYVAYVKAEAGKYELRLLQVATERDVQLLPGAPQQIRSLHFSRDGNFLYFLRVLDPAKDPNTLGVFRIGTLGGPVTTLATDARTVDQRGNSVTVSPDGKQIAYIAQTASESLIVAIDADGSNRHVLARRPVAFSFWFVEWSPSQGTLAAVADDKTDMVLFRVDLPAGSMQDLSGPRWTIGQPAWSSDATTIFAPGIDSSSPIMQIWAFDARTGTHRALTSSSTWYDQWSLSATANDDLIANTFAVDTNVSVTDQSGQPYPIPTLRGEGSDSAIWVDNRVVTGSMVQMVVHDPDGRNPTKLRAYSLIYRHLARCGPGNVVYWAIDAKRRSHIARTDITTGSSSALTEGPIDVQPTCTADGSILVFVHCSDKGGLCALTRKSLDSGQSLDLYQFDPADDVSGDPSPSVSPDGKSVLFWRYTHAEDSYEWAAIISIAGGEVKKVRMPIPASQAGAIRWAADGKSILFSRNESGVENIWSVPLAGGAPRRITNFDSDQRIRGFDVSPENRLVISRGNWISDVVLIKKVKEAAGQPPATAN